MRRKGFALPLVALVACVVGIVAIAVHTQVSSDRHMFEAVQGHRLVVLAASSAFEEASAFVEGLNRGLTLPQPTDHPGANTAVPGEIKADRTNDAFEPLGLSVGPVRAEAGEWTPWGGRADENGGMLAQELGLMTLAVEVTLRIAGSSTVWRVSCRRYVVSAAGAADGRMRVNVQPRNMVLQVD